MNLLDKTKLPSDKPSNTVARLLEIETVARTLFGEGRGEPWEALVAIAWVIRNRVLRPSWWGAGWIEVCRKPKQFSCWLTSDPNYPKLLAATMEQESYRRSYAAALVAYDGLVPDPTGGATHYWTTKAPAWAETWPPSWAPSLVPLGEHGAHSFGRELKVSERVEA